MNRRLALLALALSVLAGACAYESSGTTTTTTIDAEDLPPATGPADIVLEDQRIEGTALEVASVTLPAAGWVVVREDVGGSPGEIIGMSEILRQGVIARVPIPFFVPIEGDTVVHASIHIDMDRDGEFTYDPPDSLVDEVATFASGSAATVSAAIELLPPLQPAEAVLLEQRSDGTLLVDGSVVLPAPGFAVLMTDVDGAPGEVLATSELLGAGSHDGLAFAPQPALRETGPVFLVVWIDRDEDGAFDPEFDLQGVRPDGSIALAAALVQVVPVEPSSISAIDQEGDGSSVVIAEVTLPAPGFIEVLADDGGRPGARLAISGARVAGTYEDVVVEVDEAIDDGTTLWVRVVIDFDEDGVAGDGDRPGLVAVDGVPAQAQFTYAIGD